MTRGRPEEKGAEMGLIGVYRSHDTLSGIVACAGSGKVRLRALSAATIFPASVVGVSTHISCSSWSIWSFISFL